MQGILKMENQDKSKSYNITPCPAPRMTRADSWKQRPCVLRYWEFKDACRENAITFDNGQDITFVIPFPKSYSKKKKTSLDGQPHTIKPDVDNLMKSVLDAIYKDDSHIWHIGSIKKIWGFEGKIIIK